MGFQIFVSYSHQDAALVSPVVRMLRATRGLVFQDVDSITPGRKWRSEIAEALGAAQLVVVFWCLHSSRSSEVEREWVAAIAAAKDLLPVLLDSTPLPADLGEFQWIDFRELAGAAHAATAAPVAAEAPRAASPTAPARPPSPPSSMPQATLPAPHSMPPAPVRRRAVEDIRSPPAARAGKYTLLPLLATAAALGLVSFLYLSTRPSPPTITPPSTIAEAPPTMAAGPPTTSVPMDPNPPPTTGATTTTTPTAAPTTTFPTPRPSPTAIAAEPPTGSGRVLAYAAIAGLIGLALIVAILATRRPRAADPSQRLMAAALKQELLRRSRASRE